MISKLAILYLIMMNTPAKVIKMLVRSPCQKEILSVNIEGNVKACDSVRKYVSLLKGPLFLHRVKHVQ